MRKLLNSLSSLVSFRHGFSALTVATAHVITLACGCSSRSHSATTNTSTTCLVRRRQFHSRKISSRPSLQLRGTQGSTLDRLWYSARILVRPGFVKRTRRNTGHMVEFRKSSRNLLTKQDFHTMCISKRFQGRACITTMLLLPALSIGQSEMLLFCRRSALGLCPIV